jgi:orotate phosphoribosyltransferase-like protein
MGRDAYGVAAPAASVAAALWRTRQEVTEQLFYEVQRLRSEGYMLSEIAGACGVPQRTLQHLVATIKKEHSAYGPRSTVVVFRDGA